MNADGKRSTHTRRLSACLVNGRHTPGSPWEAECPLRHAAERSARSLKAATTRRTARGGAVAGPEDQSPARSGQWAPSAAEASSGKP
jgi:hypothetical protein